MKPASICLCVALLAVVSTGQALAATAVPKDGSYEGLTCYTGPSTVIADGKGQVAGTYDIIGTPIRKEGELGYLSSNHCVGSFSVVGKELTDSGSCLQTDPDGDRFFLVYSRRNQEPGTWKIVSGTGKYDGMEASGTWVAGAVRPVKQDRPGYVQVCNKEAGSWKLK
jgi:hypothetical protein